jgi:hypothetical protein
MAVEVKIVFSNSKIQKKSGGGVGGFRDDPPIKDPTVHNLKVLVVRLKMFRGTLLYISVKLQDHASYIF